MQLEMFATCRQHSEVTEGSYLSSTGTVQEEPEAGASEHRSQGVFQSLLGKMG